MPCSPRWLRCGIPEMAAVLYTLETGSPRLFVNNLNLLAQRFQQSPNETGTGLDVSFELVGYLQPGGAADPVAPAPTGAALPADGSGLTPAGLVPADAQSAANAQAAADARTDANANAAAYAAQAAEDAAATATNAADAAADAAAAAEADHED